MSDFVDGNAVNCYDQQMEASLAPTASITIRNLDGRVKERLRVRAAQNGRSMEAEARSILSDTLAPTNAEAGQPSPRRSAVASRRSAGSS